MAFGMRQSFQQKNIVIIGAGFSGILTAQRLEKKLASLKNISITPTKEAIQLTPHALPRKPQSTCTRMPANKQIMPIIFRFFIA